MKKSALKNRIKSYWGKHRTTIFVVALSFQLAIGLTIYFLFGRISPNDKIFVPKEGSVAFLVNQNPKFSVDFGKVGEPDKQWVRFEAQTSSKNPFEEEKGNIFRKIAKLFQKKERYGIEMSLVGVDLKGENLEKYGDEVILVADVIGTDSVKTSTELVDSGREIGVYEDQEVPVSKQTVLNKGVANGVDLEYQILKGLGLKEEIIIRDLEAYKKSCKEKECSLPLNEFVFDLKMDSDVELREGWFTIDGQSTSTYYFVDSKGRYIAHFLPNFAIDNINNKTFDVNLKVEKGEDNNYRVKVTVNFDWLLSGERAFPIRIDPSIVHDDTADFSGGIFNGVESVTGPRIQIPVSSSTPSFDCTGGTVTTNGSYRVHKFTASGSLVCTGSGSVEVLVVAGGGGGGYWQYGGGGGAGGMVVHPNMSLSTASYTVTVGNGGAGSGTGAGGRGTAGQNSVFNGITANGGGGGGGYLNDATSQPPTTGGSGGGGAGGHTGAAATQGNSGGGTGYGYAGGNGNAGGGGGAGGAGGVGTCGIGRESSITGTATYYAGGGGGYGTNGCSGGGGNSGVAGTANTGGGGGSSAAGGSGVVIVSYIPTVEKINISGEYTSSSMDMGGSISGATLSWTPSGVNTGNGETPYSTTGLVAQWNFNETSGTTAVSGGSCGTSCNGTLTNMTTTGQDAAVGTGWTANNRRWGAGAVMFDGSNDYVITNANVTNFNSSTPATFEAWVNVTSLNNALPFILFQNSNVNNQFQIGLSADQGTKTLGMYVCKRGVACNYVFSTFTINYRTWYHVVGTFDGTDIKLYINGVLQGTSAYTQGATSDGTDYIFIGSDNTGEVANRFYNGIVDSARIYSRALSAAEILSNYQAGNIEFQYRVSADNSTWSDWTSYDDGALMFDGSDDYVNIADNDSLDLTSTISLEAWINLNNVTAAYQAIVGKRDASAAEVNYTLRVGTDQLSFYYYANGAYQVYTTSNASLVPNTWYHVVATFDGSTVNIYKNSTLLSGSCASGTCNVAMIADNNSVGIGRPGDYASQYFSGIIDSVRIYSRVLGSTEISTNYAMGDGESPSSTTDLVGYWKLNERSGSSAVNIGSCGVSCNGTLTSFSDTTGKDVTVDSGWTSKTKRGGNSLWESFDNPYLYSTTAAGLISYWPMDEASGTSVADVKGSYTGTATGTIIQPGKFSNSRNFNGTSDYVNIGTSFNVCNGNACTMSAWIKPGSTTGNGYVFAKGNDNSTNSYAILISNQTVATMASATTPTWATSGNVLSAGNWYQIVGVISGQNIYTYVNGALVATNTFTGTIASSTTNARIGNQDRASYYYYFKGNIDEVHVYNTALSASTIARNYILGSSSSSVFSNKPGGIKMEGTNSKRLSNGLADGLVGYWNMNEASGTSVADLAYGQTGTATNTTIVTGKEGNARSFASGYVAVTSPAYVPTGNSAYTMEAWMYPTSTGTCGIVGWGNYGTTNQVNALRLNSSNQIMNYWWGNDLTVTVGTITTSVWHHVAATFDGTTRRIYYDGMLAGSDAPVNHNVPNTSNFRIGSTNGGEYFAGRLDETKIYNIAKTADQIKEEYDTGIVYYANYNLDSTDLSTKSTIPFYIAGDKAGSYISATLGESEYANYQTDSNTVGLWHMEETAGSGAYILDSSGLTGVNLTPTGTTYSSSGKLGGARIFSGSGNYLTVSSGFSQITTLSVSLWFKTSNTTRQTLFGQSSSAPTGAPSSFVPNLVIQTDGKIRAEYWTGAVGAITTTGAYNDGLWHHVEFVGSGTSQQLFVDGASIGTRSGTITQSWWTVTTIGTGYDSTVRGAAASAWQYFNGSIDEVRISNVARTADEIRQAYEVGLRTHPVTIDFGASLVSGNLITGSGDTSFSIDATTQGLEELGSNLYAEEKVIVREVINSVEYIAQGTVATINATTGAVTVSSWDTGSTFPSGGFTVSASVFKWQKEYVAVRNRTIPIQVDAVSLLTLRISNTFGGRNIWIDDLRSTSGYLSTYTGETFTFPSSGRYFQYRAIFSTWDGAVTPYISQVQLTYGEGSETPTMEKIMKHGKWFNSGGVKQPFWWVNHP